MAQKVKVLAAKLDDQTWVPRIHLVEEPTPESCHVCTMAHKLTYIHYIYVYIFIIIKIYLIFNSSKNKKADKMPQNTYGRRRELSPLKLSPPNMCYSMHVFRHTYVHTINK